MGDRRSYRHTQFVHSYIVYVGSLRLAPTKHCKTIQYYSVGLYLQRAESTSVLTHTLVLQYPGTMHYFMPEREGNLVQTCILGSILSLSPKSSMSDVGYGP